MLNPEPRQKEPKTVFGARRIAARRVRGMIQIPLTDTIVATERVISYSEAEGGNPNFNIFTRAQAEGTTTVDPLGLTPTNDHLPEPKTVDERRCDGNFGSSSTCPRKTAALLRMLDSLAKTNSNAS